MRLKGIRHVFFSTLIFCGLWCTQKLQAQNHRIVMLTENSTGKTLIINRGQLLMLTLPDHIDGGYRFDSIQYLPSIITLQKHTANPPPFGSLVGRSGKGTWQFIARAAGHSIIKVAATRPWKGGGTVIVFKDEIIVR